MNHSFVSCFEAVLHLQVAAMWLFRKESGSFTVEHLQVGILQQLFFQLDTGSKSSYPSIYTTSIILAPSLNERAVS